MNLPQFVFKYTLTVAKLDFIYKKHSITFGLNHAYISNSYTMMLYYEQIPFILQRAINK